MWSPGRDSNPRPAVREAAALSAELLGAHHPFGKYCNGKRQSVQPDAIIHVVREAALQRVTGEEADNPPLFICPNEHAQATVYLALLVLHSLSSTGGSSRVSKGYAGERSPRRSQARNCRNLPLAARSISMSRIPPCNVFSTRNNRFATGRGQRLRRIWKCVCPRQFRKEAVFWAIESPRRGPGASGLCSYSSGLGSVPSCLCFAKTSRSPPLIPARPRTSFLRDSMSYWVVMAICSMMGEPPP